MILKKNECSPQRAADSLKKGEIVILPTDTVYGFSGIVQVQNKDDATFCTDVKIRKIKGRSETKPLIQLIAKPEDIFLYTDDSLPKKILDAWPGALTVIVNIKESSPLHKFYPTIAFRCPGDCWLREIIALCNAPVYSTSVNRSGCPVLESPAQINAEFSDETALIIDDGEKKGALPSTLISIEKGTIKVLRQGSVII